MNPTSSPRPLGGSRVLVVTGAGISAESGIPTFRGAGGYWRNRNPADLATEAAFRADPELVWDWYRERRASIRGAEPNPAHAAVVQLASLAREFLLITQNVDDLHDRARWQERRLPAGQGVQIHGDIFVTRCSRCAYQRREAEADEPPAGVPRCPRCEAWLRPGVVWFGESLPAEALRRVEAFLGQGGCDLTVVIGTTALFGYIVEWATHGLAGGGELIEINPEPSMLSRHATATWRAPAAQALPQLVAQRTQS